MAKTLVQVNTDTALDLSNEIEQFNSRFNSFINSLQSGNRENHLETISLIKRNSRIVYDSQLDYIKDQVAAKKEREDVNLTAKAEEPPLTQPKAEPKEVEKKEPNIFEKIATVATVATGTAVLGTGEPASSPGMFNIIEYITGDVTYTGNGRNFYVDIAGHGLPSNYHDHVACSTVEDKERAKTALRAAGIQIGNEYREGSRGYHGKNLAFDVPGSQWDGSGVIGPIEYRGSAKVRSILGIGGGGQSTAQPPKPKPKPITPTSTPSPKPQVQAQQKRQPQTNQIASSSSPGMLNTNSSGLTTEQLFFATV